MLDEDRLIMSDSMFITIVKEVHRDEAATSGHFAGWRNNFGLIKCGGVRVDGKDDITTAQGELGIG